MKNRNTLQIAHVTHSFPPYEAGTGRVCYFNALELGRLGHDVTVFTPDYPQAERAYPSEFTVKRLDTPFKIGNAPFMPYLLHVLQGFDIVHLHYPFIFGAEFVWLACKRLGIPYVLTHHNDLLTEGVNLRHILFKLYFPVSKYLTARQASKWIVVSRDHAQNCNLTPLFTQRWSDVHEVPNGVDLSVFRPIDNPQIRNQYGIPQDDFLILYVGALDRAHLFKGVQRLIEAASRLANNHWHLLIVGDGDMKTTYENTAIAFGVESRCTFSGRVAHNALPVYYSAADVLVLPSSPPESFGMVLIEAGACETAVIASNIPGVRHVVQDGFDGLLVNVNDVTDLVDKLTYCINTPEITKIFGKNGYQKVIKKYNWASVAPLLVAVYHQAIDAHLAGQS